MTSIAASEYYISSKISIVRGVRMGWLARIACIKQIILIIMIRKPLVKRQFKGRFDLFCARRGKDWPKPKE